MKRLGKAANRKTITVEIPVRTGLYPTFYYRDCTSDIGEDNGETGGLGCISAGVGGVLSIRHKPSGRECFIWPPDLWAAVVPVLEGLGDEDYDAGWELTREPAPGASPPKTKTNQRRTPCGTP